MNDDNTPPQLIRYGPPYGAEKLPELTKEEIEAISTPSLYLHSLKTIVELEAKYAELEAAVSTLHGWGGRPGILNLRRQKDIDEFEKDWEAVGNVLKKHATTENQ